MHEAAGHLPNVLLSLDQLLDREFEAALAGAGDLAVRVAYGVLRRREDAEEVAQEAFARPSARSPRCGSLSNSADGASGSPGAWQLTAGAPTGGAKAVPGPCAAGRESHISGQRFRQAIASPELDEALHRTLGVFASPGMAAQVAARVRAGNQRRTLVQMLPRTAVSAGLAAAASFAGLFLLPWARPASHR